VQTDLTPGPDAAFDVVMQQNGRFVAVGTAAGISVAVRYRTDGSIDPTFGDRGVVALAVGRGFNFFSSVERGNDGDLVFAGRAGGQGGRMVIARVDAGGDPDTSFSNDGFQLVNFTARDDWAWDVEGQNGRFVLVGAAEGTGFSMAVARINSSGNLDP